MATELPGASKGIRASRWFLRPSCPSQVAETFKPDYVGVQAAILPLGRPARSHTACLNFPLSLLSQVAEIFKPDYGMCIYVASPGA